MILRTLLLAATLTACTAPSEQTAASPNSPQPGCDLKVDFASIGTGIDSDVLQRVDSLLSGDTGVSTVDRKRWGLEGETTLCVDTRTDADTTRLFGAVKATFPATSSKPISVETRSGEAFRVPTP